MECKITSTERKRDSGAAAFAMVEILIALAIGSLVVAAMMSVFSFSARNFAAMANYADLDKSSRNALDLMTRDMRKTLGLTSHATNKLVFKDFDNQSLTYTYDSAARTLTRTKNGESTVLLKECDTLSFQVFQRNPIGGTYDQYPPSTNNFLNTCKLVQLNWICSRTILGAKVNTESVQSAKIVLRNQ